MRWCPDGDFWRLFLPYFGTWCGLSANLECRSEMRCSRLAANTGRKKVDKNRHLGTIAQLRRAISSELRYVSAIGKKLLSNNTSSTCPYNMVNFGPLAAEIVSLVWGTPGNFNGYSVTARDSGRGRQIYLAGRPSRWSLAHISSFILFHDGTTREIKK